MQPMYLPAVEEKGNLAMVEHHALILTFYSDNEEH
jgi:hypothetical protein